MSENLRKKYLYPYNITDPEEAKRQELLRYTGLTSIRNSSAEEYNQRRYIIHPPNTNIPRVTDTNYNQPPYQYNQTLSLSSHQVHSEPRFQVPSTTSYGSGQNGLNNFPQNYGNVGSNNAFGGGFGYQNGTGGIGVGVGIPVSDHRVQAVYSQSYGHSVPVNYANPNDGSYGNRNSLGNTANNAHSYQYPVQNMDAVPSINQTNQHLTNNRHHLTTNPMVSLQANGLNSNPINAPSNHSSTLPSNIVNPFLNKQPQQTNTTTSTTIITNPFNAINNQHSTTTTTTTTTTGTTILTNPFAKKIEPPTNPFLPKTSTTSTINNPFLTTTSSSASNNPLTNPFIKAGSSINPFNNLVTNNTNPFVPNTGFPVGSFKKTEDNNNKDEEDDNNNNKDEEDDNNNNKDDDDFNAEQEVLIEAKGSPKIKGLKPILRDQNTKVFHSVFTSEFLVFNTLKRTFESRGSGRVYLEVIRTQNGKELTGLLIYRNTCQQIKFVANIFKHKTSADKQLKTLQHFVVVKALAYKDIETNKAEIKTVKFKVDGEDAKDEFVEKFDECMEKLVNNDMLLFNEKNHEEKEKEEEDIVVVKEENRKDLNEDNEEKTEKVDANKEENNDKDEDEDEFEEKDEENDESNDSSESDSAKENEKKDEENDSSKNKDNSLNKLEEEDNNNNTNESNQKENENFDKLKEDIINTPKKENITIDSKEKKEKDETSNEIKSKASKTSKAKESKKEIKDL